MDKKINQTTIHLVIQLIAVLILGWLTSINLGIIFMLAISFAFFILAFNRDTSRQTKIFSWAAAVLAFVSIAWVVPIFVRHWILFSDMLRSGEFPYGSKIFLPQEIMEWLGKLLFPG
ncbi:hypothetical protein JXM67_15085 [candidate division WOR-3 bacterium]|nr:hypothetical protein [candidate division WOR-3 bacterium]